MMGGGLPSGQSIRCSSLVVRTSFPTPEAARAPGNGKQVSQGKPVGAGEDQLRQAGLAGPIGQYKIAWCPQLLYKLEA